MNNCNNMLERELFRLLKNKKERQNLYSRIHETIEDCSVFEVLDVLYNCIEKDDCLYDKKGNRLACGGLVDELYYCDQAEGYCEDYHGYMYYQIDKKGTFIKVYYEC